MTPTSLIGKRVYAAFVYTDADGIQLPNIEYIGFLTEVERDGITLERVSVRDCVGATVAERQWQDCDGEVLTTHPQICYTI